ncbi:MAG: hypothetical protein OXC09_12215 [Truepera sp.]|nr:hypothetical protein [Truepera sp.]
MITLENDRLVLRFSDIHGDARCAIEFQRTLRIPDDDRDYPLPPGLGRFPLRHLDDHAPRLPEQWRRRGGVIAPIHQAEAMWINFEADSGYPFAVKIATGKICALTGDGWVDHLNSDPQDYVVLPEQPWLDGYCVERGVIRQFVAMPLGDGYTVEEQLTGAARHGGLQIVVYPMKRERYRQLLARDLDRSRPLSAEAPILQAPSAIGLAPGGRMKQEVYDDPHGLDAWDQRHGARCFITLANSTQWLAITGERPPTVPPTAKQYTEAGFPWFEWYGGDAVAVAGAEKFKSLASVTQLGKAKGEEPLPENETTEVPHIIGLGSGGVRPVREYPADETGG